MLDNYVLEEEELDKFRSSNWLGDENIEFFWEQIAQELNPTTIAPDILFVPPAVIMSVKIQKISRCNCALKGFV